MYFFRLLIMVLFIPSIVWGATTNELTIINHYDRPLRLIHDSSETLPELPTEYILKVNHHVKTTVVDTQEEAYIRAEDVINTAHNAFFGVEIVNQQLQIHGYISEKIAYSWDTNTVTFCTPTEYAKKESC